MCQTYIHTFLWRTCHLKNIQCLLILLIKKLPFALLQMQVLAENGGTQFSSAWYWTSDYSGKCPWHEGGDYYIVNPITGATKGTGCDAVDYLHVRAVIDN